MKRGLTNDPTCPYCSGSEDINHLFRDCYKAKEVLIATFGRNWYLDMVRKHWMDWLKCNARNKNILVKTSLGTLCLLWVYGKFGKTEILLFFYDKTTNYQESVKFILDYSTNIHQAFLNMSKYQFLPKVAIHTSLAL